MRALLLIGVGGFAGAIGRYAVSGWAQRVFSPQWFPWGTLTVNLIGCFVIGLLKALADSTELLSPDVRTMVFIGFLGSFTTFSTFGFETLALAREGNLLFSFANIAAHIILGLLFVWLGMISINLTGNLTGG